MILPQQASNGHLSHAANVNVGNLEFSDIVVHVLILVFIVHFDLDNSESRNYVSSTST